MEHRQTTALYQQIEDIRVASNVKQAELAPLDPTTLAGQNALQAFNPQSWGDNLGQDQVTSASSWLDTPTA